MPILIKGSGGKKAKLQAKTVTPTSSTQTVTPGSGFDGLSKCTVNAIPSSYVQPSQKIAATTYTPSTSNQYISSGTYCSGLQTIKGDSNLVASNIKKGVNIFGKTGTYAPEIVEGKAYGSGDSITIDISSLTKTPYYVFLVAVNPQNNDSYVRMLSWHIGDYSVTGARLYLGTSSFKVKYPSVTDLNSTSTQLILEVSRLSSAPSGDGDIPVGETKYFYTDTQYEYVVFAQ